MNKIIALAAAVAASGMLLTATAASAQTPGYYAAVTAAPTAKTSLVTRSVIWSCEGTTCVASKAPETDATLCGMVARQVGKLSAFTVAGTPFAEDKLAACNARAK